MLCWCFIITFFEQHPLPIVKYRTLQLISVVLQRACAVVKEWGPPNRNMKSSTSSITACILFLCCCVPCSCVAMSHVPSCVSHVAVSCVTVVPCCCVPCCLVLCVPCCRVLCCCVPCCRVLCSVSNVAVSYVAVSRVVSNVSAKNHLSWSSIATLSSSVSPMLGRSFPCVSDFGRRRREEEVAWQMTRYLTSQQRTGSRMPVREGARQSCLKAWSNDI